jgi:chemotaxis protein CheX
MSASYVLPEMIDLASVASLQRDLLAFRGADLDVDASPVRKLGGLGLQVLLAAGATWERDGHTLRVLNRSDALTEALRLAGSSLPGDQQ